MTDVDVVVVGAGFGGLCAGAKLLEGDHADFVILEREEGLGGTWRANRYPGAACDVPSHLYSLSFARAWAWSRRYAPQGEILAYMEWCAQRFGLAPHFRFGTEVVSATYSEADARWLVRTKAGTGYRARFMISATGGLSRPRRPDIEGLDAFAGPVVHSAQWDPEAPIDGARVGVIGTGASAIQVVPQLTPRVRHLSVFQRSPPWILPREDRAYRGWEKAALRQVPGLGWLARMRLYWRHEVRATAFVRDLPRIRGLVEGWARRHMESQVSDPGLRAELTPSFAIGCKRVLLADDYYPALMQPHVDLVTSGIARIDAHGVHIADGTYRELDVLVLCTGFRASEDMAPFPLTGRDGRDLKREWGTGGAAYLGTMVSGYPNFFMIVGPNTGLGHSSMIFIIECQVRYIMAALRAVRRRGASSLNVRPEAQARFTSWLERRMGHTVWTRGGCQSWYLTEGGRNTTLWPGYTMEFARRTRRPVPADFAWD